MIHNPLYNFISPITGRIIIDPDYILVGNRHSLSTPSPSLIDMKLEIINLRMKINSLQVDYDTLASVVSNI